MTERKFAYPHAYVSWSKKILSVETHRADRTEGGQGMIYFYILEDCLNRIPSLSPSLKIQIVGAKIAKLDEMAFTDLSKYCSVFSNNGCTSTRKMAAV